MIAKNKPVRITGKKMAELNAAIHQRDSGCVLCRRWVDPGEKFHHEPCGPFKQDRVDCGVILCGNCHHERHFGQNPNDFRDRIERYLGGLYDKR